MLAVFNFMEVLGISNKWLVLGILLVVQFFLCYFVSKRKGKSIATWLTYGITIVFFTYTTASYGLFFAILSFILFDLVGSAGYTLNLPKDTESSEVKQTPFQTAPSIVNYVIYKKRVIQLLKKKLGFDDDYVIQDYDILTSSLGIDIIDFMEFDLDIFKMSCFSEAGFERYKSWSEQMINDFKNEGSTPNPLDAYTVKKLVDKYYSFEPTAF